MRMYYSFYFALTSIASCLIFCLRRKSLFPSMLLFVTLFYGCAPKIATQVTMPARVKDVSSLRTVAVMPFDGNFGSAATESTITMLTGVDINNNKYFTVVERQNLEDLFNEIKLQQSGITDQESVVKLGEMIGANGIYMGNSDIEATTSDYSESRSKCTNNGYCYDYNVSCYKRTVELEMVPKLVDISTGEIVYSNRMLGSSSDTHCSDYNRPIMTDTEIAMEALKQVFDDFRKDVAPYNIDVEIELLDQNDGISNSKGKKALESGINFAKTGRLDRACDIWSDALRNNSDSIALNYNLGVCFELSGEEESALTQYYAADKLATEPNSTINDALVRVKQRIDNKKILKSQM